MKFPTLIFEELGTGDILHKEETTFVDFAKKVVSVKKSGKMDGVMYIAYLQIDSRINHCDSKFEKLLKSGKRQ